MQTAWLVLAALVCATTARAQGVYDHASAWRGGSNPIINYNASETLMPGSDSFSYHDSVISHFSQVLQGYNHLSIHMATPPYVYPNGVYGSSSASTQWIDELTISNPLYTGQQGTITVSALFDLHGSFAPWALVPSMEADISVNGVQQVVVNANHQGLFPVNISNQTYTISATFTYGTPFTISGCLSAGGSSTNYNDGPETFDATATVQWLGITEVLRPSGTAPDTVYTLSSASGTDYSVAAVPEPATATLMMGGLGGLFAAARRQKRK